MTSHAQRVLVVVVIDPRWRLELRSQEDSLAASQAVLTTINATGVFLFINFPKTRNWKKYGFNKFQEKTLNRQMVIEFVVNTSKVVRRLTWTTFQQYFHSQKHTKRWIRNLEKRSSVSTHQQGRLIRSPLTDPARQHRKLFKIPSWELNGKFSHHWEKPGTRNSFFGIMLGSRCLPAS